MKELKLCKYVKSLSFDETSIALFNTLNTSLVLIEKEKAKNNFEKLDANSLAELKKLDFFLDDRLALKKIIEGYNSSESETLQIIIEMTQLCNLSCIYCYQSNWEKNSHISYETIDKTIIYIENCFKLNNYKTLIIEFFGGEAFLEVEKMIYIQNKLIPICEKYKVKIIMGVNTNGTLITKDILKEFINLNVHITLTPKYDHDKMRPYKNGEGSYDIILQNIINCKSLFSKEKYNLFIRYNVNDANIKDFDKIVTVLKKEINNFSIKPSYTENHPYNAYINFLPENEFKIWNSSECIDILIKNNLNVKQKPAFIKSKCYAFQKDNIKVFSDGFIGLCNSYFPKLKKIRIDDICNNPVLTQKYFPEKRILPIMDIKCLKCTDILLCGGKSFCKIQDCNFGQIFLDVYLKTYIKYILEGKKKYFLNFHNDYISE